MSAFLVRYLVGWVACCVLGLALFLEEVHPRWRDEARFLLVPWKLALFLPGIGFVTLAGRYTDDETWDVRCGGGMALLTFLTSGWSVGTLVKALRGERSASELVVALVVALFSSSWAPCCRETARTRTDGWATCGCLPSSPAARGWR
jgi:hypothetical protein